jgi:hypothetical protein
VVVEAHGDQPAQIDRGHPQRQAELVAGQAAVADPAVALATSQAIERSTIGRQRR